MSEEIEDIFYNIPRSSRILEKKDYPKYNNLKSISKYILQKYTDKYVITLLQECNNKIKILSRDIPTQFWIPECIIKKYIYDEKYVPGGFIHYGLKTGKSYDRSLWNIYNIEMGFDKVQRMLSKKGYYLKQYNIMNSVYFEIGFLDYTKSRQKKEKKFYDQFPSKEEILEYEIFENVVGNKDLHKKIDDNRKGEIQEEKEKKEIEEGEIQE